YLEYQAPKGECYLFLDEIQEIPRWEKWIRTTQELAKANLVLSGSNSKLLSGELATVLTGRHLDITVMPLSFQEFLSFKNLEIKKKSDLITKDIESKKLLQEFLEFGSFPIVVLEEEKKKELLLNYYDDTVNRDLIKRYKIRKTEKLKSLTKFYLSNISSPITFASAGQFLQMSAETTERFSGYLEASYLVFFLKRFSYKFKEQEKSPRKVYAVDTGIANTVGFRFSPNLGKLAENVVFLELKRRSYLNPFLEIYYWKSLANEEVDFIVKEDSTIKELIQVCWNLGDIQTKKRETKALLKAMAEFNLTSGLIIAEDFEGEENYDGKKIKYVSLRRWLLGL
ncbi:MAG: ATP-binding protein, partial [Candidatus Moraniibacteriota bacterium]